jgi:exopolysaccharide biosynthesis polyprenyl glycosylphosphotransferase
VNATFLEKLFLVFFDLSCFFSCYFGAYWVQFHSGWIADKYDPTKVFSDYSTPGLVITMAWFLLFLMAGMYRRWMLRSRFDQIFRVVRLIFVVIAFIIIAIYGLEAIAYVFHPERKDSQIEFLYHSRLWLIISYGVAMMVSVSFFRISTNITLRKFFKMGYSHDAILVLGATKAGARIIDQLHSMPELGQRVVGVLDERSSVLPNASHAGVPILGKYANLPELIKKYHVKGIIISHRSGSHNEILRILRNIVNHPLHIYVIPDLYDTITGHFHSNRIHGADLKELFPQHMPSWQVSLKRMLDIVCAAGLLLLSLPLTALTALFIKLEDKGPIFYSQERVGLYGKPFLVYKFRTMRTDAEKFGPQWATKHDPRITKIGRILRRSRIDEIPQLWCVLKGDMSMVGPRPERQFFIDQLKEQIPLYISRLKMKPGLTGWAQVRHHYDTSIEDVEEKLRYDLYYFENMSLGLDIQILARTIWVVLTGKGAQ